MISNTSYSQDVSLDMLSNDDNEEINQEDLPNAVDTSINDKRNDDKV